jgi:hypothetical protein
MNKTRSDCGDLIDGGQKRIFIRFGWLVKAADFSNKLQRSGLNLFRRNRRIKIEQRSDISAHFSLTSSRRRNRSAW